MIFQELTQHVKELNAKIIELAEQGQQLEDLSLKASQVAEHATQAGGESPFIMGLTVFVLAIFVGYYVVWKVTPALHSPLMAVTNAISSVIIVGALLSCGLAQFGLAKIFGFLGVILAAINIFGGFIVTQRMLGMFMKKK
jgi:NAD(P) transhydrogenase subunit alpha